MIRGFFCLQLFVLLSLFYAPVLPCAESTIPKDFLEDEPVEPNHKGIDPKYLLMKTILVLGGIVGTLYGTAYFIKRMGGGKYSTLSTDGAIRLIEKKHLSPKTAIWLVEVNDQPMVIVDSQNAAAIHPIGKPSKIEDPS
jgi:flagellar biogenesis protein FliO